MGSPKGVWTGHAEGVRILKPSLFAAAMLRYAKFQPYGAPDFSDPIVVEFWYDALSKYSADQLGSAMKQLAKGRRFPSISDIETACGDLQLSDDSAARDVVKRIENCIRRFGYIGWDKVKPEIGEFGVHLVQMSGGWEALCDIPSENDMAIKMAQLREYAKVAWKKDAAGQLDRPPSLPSSQKSNNVTALIANAAENCDLTPGK